MAQLRNPSSGCGFIEFEGVGDYIPDVQNKEKLHYRRAEIVSMRHTYPFRFIVPENSTPEACRWVFPVIFGGGFVAGDQVTGSVTLGQGCAAVISSQDSAKVYHCNNGARTKQVMTYVVGAGAVLCILQDPLVCYKNADFHQKQVVRMASSANLVLLDWIVSGRIALSESWSFKRFVSSIEVLVAGETIIRENLELQDTPHRTVAQGMQGFQVFGTCIVLGDDVAFLAESLVAKYGRKQDIGDRKGKPELVVSVSEIKYEGQAISGCYLRFLATDVQSAASVINNITHPLLHILGADPFDRKL